MRHRFANWWLAWAVGWGGACASQEFVGLPNVPPLRAHTPRASAIDVEHYALRVKLEPETRSIDASCRIRFFARAQSLTEVEFDLLDLHVREVRDTRGRLLDFDRGPESVRVTLNEIVSGGSAAEVVIHYDGAPKVGLWFSGERGGIPTQVFTQGECHDSRAWFPCIDEPSDRATSELCVELPPGWRSLAAGELIARHELGNGWREEHWSMTAPHAVYLTTLVAGELVIEESNDAGVPLLFAADVEHAPFLARTFAATPRILEFFGRLTGVRYPYAKYSQACVDAFPFGGMENVSATTLTDVCIGDRWYSNDFDATGLIAHEAAHQWFGNLLTCVDWSHIWLNESFATYAEWLYREEVGPLDEFRVAVRDGQDAYLAADVGPFRRPHVWNVYREPFDLFTRGGQTYPGGASRLHLLRFVLGDQAFFRGLRAYVADHRGRAVTNEDFRLSMERSSGVDLALFFEQWFHGSGYPEFDVRWGWDETRGLARLYVTQQQLPLQGTPNVFAVPADVEVRDEHGSRIVRVHIDSREQVIELDAPSRPRWIVFDKFGWIPKRATYRRSFEEWLALARFDDDVNGRRDALWAMGEFLAQPGDEMRRQSAASALLDALADEREAVRLVAVRALGRVKVPEDHEIARGLLDVARADAAPAVRAAAYQSLANWPATPALSERESPRRREHDSWAAWGAEHLFEIAMRGRAGWPGLRRALATVSLKDAHLVALCGAIARLDEPERSELLIAIVLSETRHAEARSAAARTLAQFLRGGSRWTPQFARLLLETRSYRFQSALIELLIAIGDARAVGALREFYAQSRDSRHRRAIEDGWPRLAP